MIKKYIILTISRLFLLVPSTGETFREARPPMKLNGY